jgi:hypothetical protein
MLLCPSNEAGKITPEPLLVKATLIVRQPVEASEPQAEPTPSTQPETTSQTPGAGNKGRRGAYKRDLIAELQSALNRRDIGNPPTNIQVKQMRRHVYDLRDSNPGTFPGLPKRPDDLDEVIRNQVAEMCAGEITSRNR